MKKCKFCNFLCKDALDECVFCGHKLQKTNDKFVKYDFNIKDKIDKDSLLKYYCYKCKKTSTSKHCVVCNSTSLLALEYNGKRAILNYIESLKEIFTEKEAEEIALLLTDEEKYYLYYRFKEGYLYVDKHNVKHGLIYLATGVFLLMLGFSIGNNILGSSFISYVGLTLSYIIFALCANIARWNFVNANKLLDANVHIEAFSTIVILGLVYFTVLNLLKWSFINCIILGLAYVAVVVVVFAIIELTKMLIRKNK